MRKYLLFWLISMSAVPAAAQKPRIDSSVYTKWLSVAPWASDVALTADGQYALYGIRSGAVLGSSGNVDKLVIQLSDGGWKLELPGVANAVFTHDSRRALFTRNDSLGLVTLGTDRVDYLPNVRSFTYPQGGSGEWILYQPKTPEQVLVVRNLRTGKEQSFSSVAGHELSENGRTLILQTEVGKGEEATQEVSWVSLPEGAKRTVWQGGRAGNFVLDGKQGRLGFLVTETGEGGAVRSVWYYRRGMQKAIRLADDRSAGIGSGLRLDRISFFSKDGSRLFVSLEEKEAPKPNPEAVNVYVWSYTDAKLQSQQREELASDLGYTAVLRIEDGRVIRLQQEPDDYVGVARPSSEEVDELALVEDNRSGGERHWNRAYHPQYLVSTRDGTRKWEATETSLGASLSPGGKYLIYYNGEQKNWFSYEIASRTTRNITRRISTDWSPPQHAIGVAGWLEEDAAVLLYDQYDIWQVDPAGKRASANVTNGHGGRHRIFFEVIQGLSSSPFAPGEKLILSAFNRLTKDNGFYSTVLGKSGDPERLSMGRYFYYAPMAAAGARGDANFAPIKARNAERYLVRRMSATESPNYFVTSDFKTFTPLSDVHPEKAYNWLTTELVTWTTPEGKTTHGVLYKPENFDPSKRYPVIFRYYREMSHRLNAYLHPDVLENGCNLDIPSFVSNGYLVFATDIHFTVGTPGESAVSTLVSAADHLAQRPWVDGKKIGIQGCSWGGYLTNYVVANTDRFAAAVSTSGGADWISSYGSLTHGGVTAHHSMIGDFIGATLWERPDLYIKHSAVLRADKVTTPLLLMHTTADGAVPFSQAIEFFTGLRRLGKRVWLLEYGEGNHGILGKPAEDFRIRMRQFFDHYLKDGPPAKWMTEGIPARLKGVETGLELDTSGKVPGPGLLRESGGPQKSPDAGSR